MALAMERERLLARSALLRDRVTEQAAVLTPVLTLGDRVSDAVRWGRSHPALLASALVVVVVLRPRFVWRWALRGWTSWQLVRRLHRRFQGVVGD